MKFGSSDDGEHNGIGFVSISNIFAIQGEFFDETLPFCSVDTFVICSVTIISSSYQFIIIIISMTQTVVMNTSIKLDLYLLNFIIHGVS